MAIEFGAPDDGTVYGAEGMGPLVVLTVDMGDEAGRESKLVEGIEPGAEGGREGSRGVTLVTSLAIKRHSLISLGCVLFRM